MRWEYAIARIGPDIAHADPLLNDLGKNGWELVSVVSLPFEHGEAFAFMKRPVRGKRSASTTRRRQQSLRVVRRK